MFGYQLNNGIPIASWYEDAADCELLHLLPFLAKLATAPDVRPLVAQRFPLHRYAGTRTSCSVIMPYRLVQPNALDELSPSVNTSNLFEVSVVWLKCMCVMPPSSEHMGTVKDDPVQKVWNARRLQVLMES